MEVAPQIAERLRCPRCGERPEVRFAEHAVVCPNGHRFAITDGYLDFSQESELDDPTSKTFASFGYEWNAFDELREEDERFAEIYFRDLDLESLAGQVGLDAGCGKGRFTRFLATHLEATVALDGSSAVEAAAPMLKDISGVTVVKSDLRSAPFAPGSFDFIASLGVLHHLSDPREGFQRLLTYLAPGGRVLLYIYSRPSEVGARSIALASSAAIRKLTVRIPYRPLKAISTPVAAGLYAGVVRPGRWGAEHHVDFLAGLPMSTYRDKPFRSLVLDTFDRLSAPVEHRYVWEELEGWFAEEGLVVDAARDEAGWFILAHRADGAGQSD